MREFEIPSLEEVVFQQHYPEVDNNSDRVLNDHALGGGEHEDEAT